MRILALIVILVVVGAGSMLAGVSFTEALVAIGVGLTVGLVASRPRRS